MEASEQIPAPAAREDQHVPPQFQLGSFHCPHCNVLSEQKWAEVWEGRQGAGFAQCGAHNALCLNCQKRNYWVQGPDRMLMVYPVVSGGPRPHVRMPDDVRGDYEEARNIVMQSPRGACGLLRLATQKLADDLVDGSGDLNAKIKVLVERGLSDEVAQALDALRVIGNNALHPGEMDLQDDTETAEALFECLNLIVEDRIARPDRIGGLFQKLPQRARDGIMQRDAQK